MKLTREVKTAILVIGTILLFIFGYTYLKGTNLLDSSRLYYVKYDNVEGLAKSASVTINGLVVGKVTDIKFQDKQGGLVVEFTVENDFEFSKNSIVKIYSSGLISGKSLGIFPSYEGAIAKKGDTLPGEIEQGMLDAVTARLGPLEKKVETTLATVDTLLLNVTDLVDEKTRRNLQETIATLNTTARSFKTISQNVDGLLVDNKEKLTTTLTNLEVTSKNFARLSDSLSKIETGKMVADLKSLTAKMDAIVTQINDGEGNIGKLLKDDQLYQNMEGASKQLEQLLEDMKLNPKRYVHFSLFGKKDKNYTPPEDSNN